jgi:HSP20 family protein
MERLRRDMDRLFEATPAALRRVRGVRFPAIDVWADENEGVVVTSEIPGVAPDALDIAVTADTLTISGARTPDDLPEGAQYHRRERYCDEFSRTVQLPFTVDKDGVEATFENGVLRITLPRAEDEKPRQIAVKAAS